MTNQFPLSLLSTLLVVAFFAVQIHAAESPLSVVLPQRVQETVHIISMLSGSFNQQITEGQKSISQVARKIHATSDEHQLFELKSRYLALRKSNLLRVEQKIDGIESQLASLALDLGRLDKIWSKSERYGIGQGINADDPAARQSVSEMMSGIGSLVGMIEQENPATDMGQVKLSLSALDDTARRFFKSEQKAGLQQQLVLVKDWLVLSRSVKRLLASERDYLEGRHIHLQNSRIARSLKQVAPSVWGVEQKLREYHEGWDREVFEAGTPVEWQPRRHHDLSRLGKDYGS